MPIETTEITGLLRAYAAGDEGALRRLADRVYPELRRIARRLMASSSGGQTLNTTGLVHESYLKLAEGAQVDWNDRRHFFAVAARMMRQILVDAARKRSSAKRGGGRPAGTLPDNAAATPTASEDLLALDEALTRLSTIDPRLTSIVECRYFAGYTESETAEVLGLSLRTVQREWKVARAWLRADLAP